MMDDIPAPVFILVGLLIAVYSAFIGYKTDFMKFIIFFIAAAVLIAFGGIQLIVGKEEKRAKAQMEARKGSPPPMPPTVNQLIYPQNYTQQMQPNAPAQQPMQQYRAPQQRAPVHPQAARYRGFYMPAQQQEQRKPRFNIQRK